MCVGADDQFDLFQAFHDLYLLKSLLDAGKRFDALITHCLAILGEAYRASRAIDQLDAKAELRGPWMIFVKPGEEIRSDWAAWRNDPCFLIAARARMCLRSGCN
jgi:hypothetical protein